MAWASLKGKCFEMDENEYIYKLCLFDKAVQKGKNSAVDTDLGYVENIQQSTIVINFSFFFVISRQLEC